LEGFYAKRQGYNSNFGGTQGWNCKMVAEICNLINAGAKMEFTRSTGDFPWWTSLDKGIIRILDFPRISEFIL
jgi:hypothetical protein